MSIATSHLDLQSDDAALVIIDIQQKLAAAMPSEGLHDLLRRVVNLVECARLLELPLIVSEQYPKGLGNTLPMVGEAAYRSSSEVPFFSKTRFSCVGEPAFDAWLSGHKRRQILLTGIESHVCVFSTARDLLARGYTVHVPQDATMSRTHRNYENGLRLIEAGGGVVTNSETVVFDLLKKAEGDAFKAMSRLIK